MTQAKSRKGLLLLGVLAGLLAGLALLLAALPAAAEEYEEFKDENGVYYAMSKEEKGYALEAFGLPEGVTEWTIPAEYKGEPIWIVYITNCTAPDLRVLNVPENMDLTAAWYTGGFPNLERVNIPESNPYVYSDDGVVYEKNSETGKPEKLFLYPAGRKAESYTVLAGVETVGCDGDPDNPYLKEICLSAETLWFSLDGLKALERVSVDEASPYYRSVDGSLITKKNDELAEEDPSFERPTLRFYPKTAKTYTVPAGVERVGIGSEVIETLTLPGGIQELSIFNCEKLRSLTLSGGIEGLTAGFCTNCPALESVTVTGESERYFAEDGVLYNGDGSEILLFPPAKGGDYRIPDSVTVMPVFANCPNLESVTVSKGVEAIKGIATYKKHTAFVNCPSLRTVTFLSEEISEIEALALNCPALEEVRFACEEANFTGAEDWNYDYESGRWLTVTFGWVEEIPSDTPVTPDTPAAPDTPATPDAPSSPQTGDTTAVSLPGGLLVLLAAGLPPVVFLCRRRKD